MTKSPTCDPGATPPPAPSRWVRGGRILAISAVAVGIFALGHRFAPVPLAQAEVYQSLGQDLASGVPAFPDLSLERDKVQAAVLNGSRIYYTLSTTDKKIADVLNFYEDMYARPSQDVIPAKRFEGLNKEDQKRFKGLIDNLPEANRLLSRGIARKESKTWGMLGAIQPKASAKGESPNQVLQRFVNFARSGKVAEMGDAKVVYAIRPHGSEETTVFTFWPDEQFQISSLALPDDQDAPGGDIPGVPRAAGSRRVLSYGQDMKGVRFRVAMYEEDQGREDAAEGWSQRLTEGGWTEDPNAKKPAIDGSPALGRFFTRKGLEAYVQIREDGASGRTVSSVFVTRKG